MAMLVTLDTGLPCAEMISDASGKWGCRVAFGSHWFQLKWQGLGNTQALDITAKELLPIVLAAADGTRSGQDRAL